MLGVSDDTIRRWVDAGRLPARTLDGRSVVDGADLAELARTNAGEPDGDGRRPVATSARNRLPGIVVKVTSDTVMAQVDMICGSFRMVSLMSREAVEDMGLEPGSRVVASVKSTNVVVDAP